jgi:F0F1-type ATP synthase assembly protein I
VPKSGKEQADWRRLLPLGFELFGAVLGFSLLGFWIDRHYGTRPWGLLTCAVLGLVGGLYNLIRTSLSVLNPPRDPKAGDSGDDRQR